MCLLFRRNVLLEYARFLAPRVLVSLATTHHFIVTNTAIWCSSKLNTPRSIVRPSTFIGMDDQTDTTLGQLYGELSTLAKLEKSSAASAQNGATMRRETEDKRDSLRLQTSVLSREKIRNLSILDLPEELLIAIFEYVRGPNLIEQVYDAKSSNIGKQIHDLREDELGRNAVANVRLACRRFCDTSSHLPITSMDLEVTPDSLTRLECISRHPAICKGVKRIALHTHLYRPIDTPRMNRLISSCADFVCHRLRADSDFSVSCRSAYSGTKIAELFEKGEEIVNN